MKVNPGVLRSLRLWLIAAVAALVWLESAGAQAAYPDHPIILVVPYGAGGGVDIVARILARGISKQLGQSAVVENRPGGGGTIGTAYVARATPDGYTLLVGDVSALTISPSLYKGLPFRIDRDLAPLSMLATSALDIAINPKLTVNTIQGLIEYARANPGKLNYSSPGDGTIPHLAGVLFGSMTHTSMTHIPYKSGAEAVNALLSDQVQVSFAQVPLTAAMLPAGRLKILGVSSSQPSLLLPAVAPIETLGVPGYVVTSWVAAMAPAGTPAPVVNALTRAIAASLSDPETRTALARSGFDAVGGGPAELGRTINAETGKWKKVIDMAGLKMQ